MIALLTLALAVDPRALVERAQALSEAQAAERARYFAREDIVVTAEQPDGSRQQKAWRTYEAMIVEGRLRYRLVARNGQPLPAPQQKLQPDGRRSSLGWKQLLAHHDFALAGEEVVDGRKAWRIRTRLLPDAPRPRKLEDAALSGPFEIWIDQQTGLERKLRWTVERPWSVWRKGATVEAWSTPIDKLFVVARTLVRNPSGKYVVETDQVYSNYRRFSGESSIQFATP